MSNRGKQIGELLNTASAAAPDVTKPLKAIGDGNMLEGVKNIFNYALTEGEKTGIAKGEKMGLVKGSAITFGVCGALYLVPKGVKFVKKKIADRKAHDEMGEKIYTSFSEELTATSDEGGAIDEEIKTSEA
jgi:hypothetical protein